MASGWFARTEITVSFAPKRKCRLFNFSNISRENVYFFRDIRTACNRIVRMKLDSSKSPYRKPIKHQVLYVRKVQIIGNKTEILEGNKNDFSRFFRFCYKQLQPDYEFLFRTASIERERRIARLGLDNKLQTPVNPKLKPKTILTNGFSIFRIRIPSPGLRGGGRGKCWAGRDPEWKTSKNQKVTVNNWKKKRVRRLNVQWTKRGRP